MSLVCVFDTETTDLISSMLIPLDKQPRIIEINAQLIDPETFLEEGPIEELDFLCHPGFKINETVQKITGIKPDDLQGKAPFRSRAEEVNDFLQSAEEFVAHNLAFDKAIVEIEMERSGLDFSWPSGSVMTCTVEETEHLKGHRLKLSDLYEHLFGETFEGAHRAKADVDALVKCFVKLRLEGNI